MQSELAQQATSLRRWSDRPQAKRGAICLKTSDHHPPRLQVRPDEAWSRPPANRSAADLATKLRIITAARSGAARRSSSSCLTARPTLPASKPKRGQPCRQAPYHHCRAKQCGKTMPELLFNLTTQRRSSSSRIQRCGKPYLKILPGDLGFQTNSNAALSRRGTTRCGRSRAREPRSA